MTTCPTPPDAGDAPPASAGPAALAASHLAASVRAAARAGSALADTARKAGSTAALLRATAAAGASIAHAAVSLAAIEASLLSADAPAPAAPAPDDAALLALLRGRSVNAISDVVAVMRAIDEIVPAGDGLGAFNRLYRMVTEGVGTAPKWEDPTWLLGLDVIFADLYFDGVEHALAAPATAPRAWRALVDRRSGPGIAPIQFALAGMSAHINRDLAVAVARTWARFGPADHGRDTASYRDYVAVNTVLDATEPDAMHLLATGLVARLDTPAADWAALQVVHAARDLAWTHAENLAALGIDTEAAGAYVDTLDAVAADIACAALVRIP